MFRRDARRQLPSRKTTVQDFIPTFVSMKLLGIFNETLAHFHPCFFGDKSGSLWRDVGTFPAAHSPRNSANYWYVHISTYQIDICKGSVRWCSHDIFLFLTFTSGWGGGCWRGYRLQSQRAGFSAFQCSVNLDIFDQGPWHFNICDVKVTISCRVCRCFDERLGHLQLCLWWIKQKLYAITWFCLNLTRAWARRCHKLGWFNLLKLNLSEWARLKMFTTNCHYLKLNLQ